MFPLIAEFTFDLLYMKAFVPNLKEAGVDSNQEQQGIDKFS